MCIVDVGGVGFSVAITPAHSKKLAVGSSIIFATTLIVREDSMQLFGFESATEQGIFEALLSVSGIGPRSALAVLSHMGPREIYAAVVAEDDAPFRKVSGIGPKTAKLVVVSLAGRLSHLVESVDYVDDSHAVLRSDGTDSAVTQVVAALVGLGWNEKTASEVVAGLSPSHAQLDAAGLLRAALTQLGSPGAEK